MSASERLGRARALKGEFPPLALCAALSVSRRSLCRPAVAEKDPTALLALVEAELLRWPRYGARRMHKHLGRLGAACSRREVERCYRLMGAPFSRPRRRGPRATDSKGVCRYPDLSRGLKLDRPDQLWAADVTSVPVAASWAYLAMLVDGLTRRIVGWALRSRTGSALALEALETALMRGRPEIHHSDGDTCYASKDYTAKLRGVGARTSMSPPSRPQDNGKAERLNRTVKDEEVSLGSYATIDEARESIGRFVERYNNERVHQALGYKTPQEALESWLRDEERRPGPSLERPNE